MEEIYMYGSGECDQLGDIFKKRYDDEGNEMEPPLESKIPRKLNFNISLPKKNKQNMLWRDVHPCTYKLWRSIFVGFRR